MADAHLKKVHILKKGSGSAFFWHVTNFFFIIAFKMRLGIYWQSKTHLDTVSGNFSDYFQNPIEEGGGHCTLCLNAMY